MHYRTTVTLVVLAFSSSALIIVPVHSCSLYHADIFVQAEKAVYNVGEDVIISWAPSLLNSGELILIGPSGEHQIDLDSLAGQSYDVGTAEQRDIGLWQVQIIVNDPTPGCGPVGSASNSFRVVGITTTASLVSLNVVGHSPSSDRGSQSSTTNNVNGVMYASWAGGSTQADFGDIMAVPTNTEITFSIGSIQAGFSFANKWDCYSSAYNDDDNRNWQDSSSALYTFDSQSGCPVIAFFDSSTSTPPQNSTVAVTAVGHSPSSDRGSSSSTNNNVNGVMYASWSRGSTQTNFGGTMQVPTDTDIIFTVGNIQGGYGFASKWDFWYCYSSVDSNKNNWRTDTASAPYNFAPQSSCNVIAFFDFNSQPLEASAECSPASGNVPLDVSCSVAPMGGVPPYTYVWSFGDGSWTSGLRNPTHTYDTPGNYEVQIVVSDTAGTSLAKYLTVDVSEPPSPKLIIQVVDDITSSPISGAYVFFDDNKYGPTNSNGEVTVPVKPLGPGHTSHWYDIFVQGYAVASDDVNQDVINQGRLVVRMTPQQTPSSQSFDEGLGTISWLSPVFAGRSFTLTIKETSHIYQDTISITDQSPKRWCFLLWCSEYFHFVPDHQTLNEPFTFEISVSVDSDTPAGSYSITVQLARANQPDIMSYNIYVTLQITVAVERQAAAVVTPIQSTVQSLLALSLGPATRHYNPASLHAFTSTMGRPSK